MPHNAFPSASSPWRQSPEDVTAHMHKFLDARRFAVVGASPDPAKWGNKTLNVLLVLGKSVTPVNPKHREILGVDCVPSIQHLPDPSNTSIAIVTKPHVTLEILQEAKRTNVCFIWIQPGAQDASVIQAVFDLNLEDRCVFELKERTMAAADVAHSPTGNPVQVPVLNGIKVPSPKKRRG
ncbi:CoA binding domain-containing protein [Pterulicium gracile]|uniref:CoA binding domain-containing protein n=1 Tax=Pterulicium gracile TaxID=1884261 RepID=A0A5C3Q4B3_9AGAR|nr:CoA binding domain-containing protein [Pterula gracilis]